MGKKKLVGNVDDVIFYTILHNSTNVFCRRLLDLNVVKKVCLISEEVKSYAYRYLKTIEKSINPAFYTWVVIKRVAVKVTKFRGISL